jgi:NAD(P)-dependent dehydrogenase (short-subunit alcohol dehydrogenase family)
MTPQSGQTLEGRVAIVTGAGTIGPGVGVGKATSVVLAQQGAKLVLTDIDAERVRETEALVKAEGVEPLVFVGSVANPADCQAVVEAAVETFGTVDILINNAAASIPGTVVSLSESDWETVIGVDLMGAVRMCRYVVPVMQAAGRGAIVNISSVASARHLVHAAYASAKAGLEALTRDMAVAHGRQGIRVNAVQPGHINTPRVSSVGATEGREQHQALRNAASPLGTEGNAWDIAWAVEYLVSDRARWVTGVTLPVDGGVMCTSYLSMQPIIAAEERDRP